MYNENPLEVAKQFENAGLKYLHLVDLDGAKAGKPINLSVLESIAKSTSLSIDFGGGVKIEEDLKAVFNAGASQINIGSLAAKEPEKFLAWIDAYGNEKIILSADVKNNFVAINGWQEETSLEIISFIEKFNKIKYVVCTDISKDGMLSGPGFELYDEISSKLPNINLIASGGISSLEDLKILKEKNTYGVIVGKAIYENRISLQELQNF